jgi:hypothetical protein
MSFFARLFTSLQMIVLKFTNFFIKKMLNCGKVIKKTGKCLDFPTESLSGNSSEIFCRKT